MIYGVYSSFNQTSLQGPLLKQEFYCLRVFHPIQPISPLVQGIVYARILMSHDRCDIRPYDNGPYANKLIQ